MKILIDKTLYVVGFFSIILFGVFIFGVFMLTGCEIENHSYSKEEVDELFDSLYSELEDAFEEVDEMEYGLRVRDTDFRIRINEMYSNEELDELFRLTGVEQSIADLYVLAMVDDDFYTKAEMIVYINELEERIGILEGE